MPPPLSAPARPGAAAVSYTHLEVTFTYFKPDERKAGGAYIEVTGTVKKVDDFERLIVMQNGMKIPMDDILNIEGHIFASLQ